MKPSLLFISPQFLFPTDAGGKIRSAGILKRLKGGAFATRLLMPATADEEARWRDAIAALADDATMWRPATRGAFWKARRAAGLLTGTPISAFADADRRARRAVADALACRPNLVVFDYVQSLAMASAAIPSPFVFFAHNVESEILSRHAEFASGHMKAVWTREAAKMRRFEESACAEADGVIAVSERDAAAFKEMGAGAAHAIPTGVDADFFSFAPPAADAPPMAVFTGSMDWKANQDGLAWFRDKVWPLIVASRPDASLTVVGKNPPRALVEAAKARGLNWRFTGFVDDIRDHARGGAFVIPLRVGGGTRIKAFEAMAMGTPVVSTPLGVEGLPVKAGEHFLEADDPGGFARSVVALFDDPPLRVRIAERARRLVEKNFSQEAAARAFERCCLAVLESAR